VLAAAATAAVAAAVSLVPGRPRIVRRR
jgi:hypothetical protein